MLKSIPLLCLLLLPLLTISQSLIEPLPSDTLVEVTVDLTDPYSDFHTVTYIKSLSPDTLRVRWEIVPVNCPPNWKYIGGDENQKLPFTHNSNYTPTDPSSPLIPLILEPTDPKSIIILIVRPDETAGCCDIYMNFSLIEQWDSVIASTHFDVRVNLPDCVSSTSDEPEAAAITIAPNPCDGAFEIQTAQPIATLQAFGNLGRAVPCKALGQGRFELPEAPPGIYFLAIKTMDGKSAWAKVVKQ